MSPRARFGIAAGIVAASVGGLIAWSLSASTAYYRTPQELASYHQHAGERIRVAGKVLPLTVVRNGRLTSFTVTDGKATLPVTTDALLPDTFGAGVDVVVEGALGNQGVFSASSVLAKCPSKFKAKLNRSTGSA